MIQPLFARELLRVRAKALPKFKATCHVSIQ